MADLLTASSDSPRDNFGNCVVQHDDLNCSQACAPVEVVRFGVEKYLAHGVDADKLFLGLPWYGLQYETFGKGELSKVPFFVSYGEVVGISVAFR